MGAGLSFPNGQPPTSPVDFSGECCEDCWEGCSLATVGTGVLVDVCCSAVVEVASVTVVGLEDATTARTFAVEPLLTIKALYGVAPG